MHVPTDEQEVALVIMKCLGLLFKCQIPFGLCLFLPFRIYIVDSQCRCLVEITDDEEI